MKSGFIEANNTKFYYEMEGSGFPLVFVHAGIADNRMWNEQFHVFAEKYQTIRYDRRGFGKTKMVAGDFSLHGDLYEVLKALDIKQAIFVACSQGGKTATNFTLEHPEMTKALVLVGSALGGVDFNLKSPTQEAELEKAEEAGDLERVNELEIQIWVDGQGRTPDQIDPKVRQLVKDMNWIALQTPQDLGHEVPLEPAAANRLTEIKVPTLVVIGDRDTNWAQAASDYLAKNIPNARKIVMSNTAHLPNMEKPEEFNNHLLEFLNNI
jgi:pimeloyl-ACP methyl ester carboxylesterase